MRKSIDHVNRSGESSDAADDVFEAIHTVMHLYRSGQYRGMRAGGHELSHMEGKVLGFFAHRPGATQTDLVNETRRDKGQLARLIGGLKERGLLVATPDEADRRNIRLQLTTEGRNAQTAIKRQRRKLSEQAVASLTVEERHQLVALLTKIRANLEGEADR